MVALRAGVCLAVMVMAFLQPCCESVVIPNAAMLEWSSYEMGAMISWNIDTMAGIQGCNVKMAALPEPKLFDSAASVDFEQWAKIMQATGIKYSVLTVKHGCGFTLWPYKTKNLRSLPTYNYTIQANAKFANRDLVAEYMAAMKKYGIKPGFYYSLGSNVYLGVAGGKASPAGTAPIPGQVIIDQETYYEVVYQQVTELLSTYQDIPEMWFDGGVPGDIRDRMIQAFATLAPNTVVFQGFGVTKNSVRWVGTETGHPKQDMWSTADGAGDPNVNGLDWFPAECDTPLQNGDSWFFNKDVGARSLTEMQSVYHDTVGNNCNLMLNYAPDPEGTVHYEQEYRELGDWVSICYPANHSRYIAHVAHPPVNSSKFELRFAKPSNIDRVILMEDQTGGECVVEHNVTVFQAGADVFTVSGKWIGHKRIVLLPNVAELVDRIVVSVGARQLCTPRLSLIAAAMCLF